MPLLVAALLILLAALGLQLAMVVGVLRPGLLLALLGYAGLFAGMALILPAALRRAQRPGKQGGRDHRGSAWKAGSGTAEQLAQSRRPTHRP